MTQKQGSLITIRMLLAIMFTVTIRTENRLRSTVTSISRRLVTINDDGDKNVQKNNVFEFENGDVQIWIEQDSIHMRACDKSYNDPIELTSDTARQLAQRLNELADIIDH